jgi:hypothetical protein
LRLFGPDKPITPLPNALQNNWSESSFSERKFNLKYIKVKSGGGVFLEMLKKVQEIAF